MVIAVVGGGVAGLVAAWDLTRAGCGVTIIEGASRLGGQVWTEQSHGFLIEHGAEGYAAGRAAAIELITALGLTDRLVSQVTHLSLVLRHGRLAPLPASQAAQLVGIQADRADFGLGITSLKGGMGELVAALAMAVTPYASIQLGTTVLGLAPRDRGWEITTHRGDVLPADAVVLAIPAAAIAQLVAPIYPDAAAMLGSFRAVSSVSISLACPAGAVPGPPDAGGFISGLGPRHQGFRACSLVSAKFPGRAPESWVLLRAFFRPGRGFPVEAPDQRWVEWAVNAIWPVLGIRARPLHAWVARWPQALPRYARDHDQRVRRVTRLLSDRGSLVPAGACYRASGIAGAIESGRAAARSVLAAGA